MVCESKKTTQFLTDIDRLLEYVDASAIVSPLRKQVLQSGRGIALERRDEFRCSAIHTKNKKLVFQNGLSLCKTTWPASTETDQYENSSHQYQSFQTWDHHYFQMIFSLPYLSNNHPILPSSTLQLWHPQQLDAGQSTEAPLEVPAPKQTAQATLSFVWTLVIKTEKNRESVSPHIVQLQDPFKTLSLLFSIGSPRLA
ncbi:hypothetical protein BASA50_005007 [Batrachochytrium salamandrivorans]|uniref:Uncharacterized protein n=1 Tax=Batrachochytrium salamandrivorans TaxID=1357716 RepID=A0ABQ8FE01_9FUNG|nr:hypothetical protein BASA50_005007 [Batrachochytrium salamandrivorans]